MKRRTEIAEENKIAKRSDDSGLGREKKRNCAE